MAGRSAGLERKTDDMNKSNVERSWRPLLMIVCFILGVPLILCAGVLTWYMGRQSAAADKVHLWIEDLSQRGEPVDDPSLQLAYEISTSDENTERWVALRKILETNEFRESSRDIPFQDPYNELDNPPIVPPPGEDWPNRTAVDEFLKKWRSELQTIRELGEAEYANKGKPLRRPIEFRSVATLLPDTQFARPMARLTMLDHAVAMHDGDQQQAYQCLRACFGLERSMDGEPLIVSQLVGLAIGALASEILQKSVEHDQLSDQQMDELAANLPSFDKLCDLYEMAMRGERAMMLPLFSDPEQAYQILNIDSAAGANLFAKARSTDALYYLEIMDQWLSLPRDDLNSFRDAAKRVNAKLSNDVGNAGILEKLDHAMSYMIIPANDAFAEVIVRRAEQNNLAKLAMGVRKFHHNFDRWPESLEELNKVGVEASQLRAANWPFGYRIEKSGEAVLWGIYPTTTLTLPSEPPETEGDLNKQQNAAWVWRLRP